MGQLPDDVGGGFLGSGSGSGSGFAFEFFGENARESLVQICFRFFECLFEFFRRPAALLDLFLRLFGRLLHRFQLPPEGHSEGGDLREEHPGQERDDRQADGHDGRIRTR
ncbi:hypothetical protein ACFQVC_06715 [Streptomyces monticola]|uniref:Uncharacterized protein n=1 Tax=Streptomyces monticola TaxID=2666263 RepID=A0ABW2JEQ2_9ACTN